VDGFPVEFSPARFPFFGVDTSVSGAGFNLAKALTTLGDRVNLLSLIGKDAAGSLAKNALDAAKISRKYVLPGLAETPQSVILYDYAGRRQVNTDLKDIQEHAYPEELFNEALEDCSLTVLCNVNFSRPFIKKACQSARMVATDIHAIASLDDEFNRDFMANAHILFMSDERLPCPPEEWARRLHNLYGTEIIVIGLGDKGSLLSVWQDRYMARLPAIQVRPVVDTRGAGDALFACFLHFYHQKRDAYNALQKAMVFASYKIGEQGASNGFLPESGLEAPIR
jgi:ribokinase